MDRLIDEKMAGGFSRSDALRSARLEFGTPDGVKEEVRDVGWEARVEALWQDFRYATRRLTKTPGFTAVAAITLGLGIGANVAVFTLSWQVLFKPLPYPSPGQLVALWGDASYRGVPTSEVSPANFRDWSRQAASFSGMSAYMSGGGLTLTPVDQSSAVAVDSRQVDARFFDVVGVDPVLGRTFVEGDGGGGAAPVAVVSHAFWDQRLGGGPGCQA